MSSYASALSRASAMSSLSFKSIDSSSSFRNDKRVVQIDPSVADSVVSTYARQYFQLIIGRNLLETPENELNWSGKGQQVSYASSDTLPLQPIATLGCSLTASVDRVRCRRIHLARKTMNCNARVKLDTVITEVALLQRLRHSHVIQLVGSYLKGRTFGILLYPAADYNLAQYMEGSSTETVRRISLGRFFRCLTHALQHIHQAGIKHMDIKPKNILVKTETRVTKGDICEGDPKVYIGDFGISREFPPQDTSQTDGPTARSPMYCAPEVKNYIISGDSRGRAADVFSMGCVFLEMITVIQNKSLDEFIEHRSDLDSEDSSFCGNLENVASWIRILRETSDPVISWPDLSWLDRMVHFSYGIELRVLLLNNIQSMLQEDPNARPKAAELSRILGVNPCCTLGREPYVVGDHSSAA
ncbi:MAG: hypothetical protein M1812_001325 [Candelaria pacifica]|nr:MAG: hypothetical protein M1812_001325 [Candelaria pacifica]